MAKMEIDVKKVMNLDLYKILEIDHNASDNDIRKAYKKRALRCHPDKNPDNPDAAAEFVQLTQALEVLTDPSARAAYDNFLRAKEATEARHRQLEGKRKRLKEDLEARENAALQKVAKEKSGSRDQLTKDAAKLLEQEIERLRKEGSRLVQEEQEKLRQQMKEDALRLVSEMPDGARLRIKWLSAKSDPTNGGYDADTLNAIFCKYGEICALLVSKKKNGSAIIEFASDEAAALAVDETGHKCNPLTVSWFSAPPSSVPRNNDCQQPSPGIHRPAGVQSSSGPAASACQSSGNGGMDFESIVLMRLRQAEERKRLAQQAKEEDEKEQT
jgi:DnaJ family protein C protein 17